MRTKPLSNKALIGVPLVVGFTVSTITVTAIVTQYPGVVELTLGMNGGVMRIDGRPSTAAIPAQLLVPEKPLVKTQ